MGKKGTGPMDERTKGIVGWAIARGRMSALETAAEMCDEFHRYGMSAGKCADAIRQLARMIDQPNVTPIGGELEAEYERLRGASM
jgi:hypothetical protein